MTKELISLADLEKLEKRATPGPWGMAEGEMVVAATARGCGIYSNAGKAYPVADREFLIAFRNAFPDIVAELKRLRKIEVAYLREGKGSAGILYMEGNLEL